jgi:hypothetical protein
MRHFWNIYQPMATPIFSCPRISYPTRWKPTPRKDYLTRKYWHTPGCKTPRKSEGPIPWWPTCLGQGEVCGGGSCGLQNKTRRCASLASGERKGLATMKGGSRGGQLIGTSPSGGSRLVVDVMSYRKRRKSVCQGHLPPSASLGAISTRCPGWMWSRTSGGS